MREANYFLPPCVVLPVSTLTFTNGPPPPPHFTRPFTHLPARISPAFANSGSPAHAGRGEAGVDSTRGIVAVLLSGLRSRPRSARFPCCHPDHGGLAGAVPPQAHAAGERGQHPLAEPLVHEAVNDGVDAGGGVGQQVDEGDGRAGQAVGRAPVKGLPGVDHKDGGPAEEKEEDDDQQHADDALFGHQVGRGVGAGHAADDGFVPRVSQAAHDAPPLGRLQVTAVAVAGLEAAGAGLSVYRVRGGQR